MTNRPIRENPPVSTDPQPIELGAGLDLTSPKILVQPGSLTDCLNFEVVDRAGYKRIDGFEPYDGQDVLSNVDNFYILRGTFNGIDAASFYPAGERLALYESQILPPPSELADYQGVFGTLLPGAVVTYDGGTGLSTYELPFVLTNPEFLPDEANSMQLVQNFDDNNNNTAGVTSGIAVSDIERAYTRDGLLAHFDDLRGDITSLPSRPVGLHWHRDRLYAVVGEKTIYFYSGGTTEIFPNQFIGATSGSGLSTGRVLTVELVSGTWAGGDAVGALTIEDYESNPWLQTNQTLNIYTDDTFGSVATANVATVESPFNGVESPVDDFASNLAGVAAPATIWQSRNQTQADAESASVGWERIDPGFSLEYSSGKAGSGEFTRITKGIDPAFSATSGNTTTTGTNGAPNLLTQGVAVSGEPNPAQGWKSTVTETVYAYDSSAVVDDDGTYLYGDAQVFWNVAGGGAGYTGQPSGGIGQSSDIPLASYPPQNQQVSWTSPSSYSTYVRSSNGYAYFVVSGFQNVASNIPANSTIVGIRADVITDAEVIFVGQAISDAQIWAAFAGVRLEGQLIDFDPDTHSATLLGAPQSAALDFTLANFTETHRNTTPTRVRWTKDSESVVTLGYAGASDLWGLTSISREQILSDRFAIAFRVRADCATTEAGGGDNSLFYRAMIERIRIRVYYQTPSVRYYFDVGGGEVIQGDLTYYDVVTGSLTNGDGAGTMQFINVEPVAGDTARFIPSGSTIHTANPPSSGNQVAVVAADMEYNGLPGFDQLLENNSRYQFITANFYGTDGLDGFYGVSGAGKAFSFNTFENSGTFPYIVKITTNTEDEDGDKPRHVAFHHYHLALGFGSGIVRFSVPGEPESFDGLLGATEVGVGDKITGLGELDGTTLGVWCENSIRGVRGTDADNFTTITISPYTGALEYTLADLGYGPIWCDAKGIKSLSGGTPVLLSEKVTPWLQPRLLRNIDPRNQLSTKSAVCAYPVRAKNQYRVVFKDGYQLSCTLNPQHPPALTFSRYWIGNSQKVQGNYLIPLAYSAQADDTGKERVFVATYSPFETFSADEEKYVYEIETGWGFGGYFIPAYFVTNWYHQNPYQERTIKNIRMDGLTLGFGSTNVAIAKDYEEVYNTVKEPISLPAVPADYIYEDFKPATHMAHVGRTGRNLSIKIEDTYPSGDNINDPVPPCIHQVMLVQYSSGGKTDS